MGNEKADLWALLREARETLESGEYYTKAYHEQIDRIDAALAQLRPVEGHKTCEFCKGKGHVPAKKAWSPESVLGQDNGR